jgi:NAD(P)-dependent dehydrogenase (short-subunit alcohol dehydrogenase family)
MEKNIIITGAAGGIGSEIASFASKKGYRVGLIDSNQDKLAEVEARIENSISLPTDITNEKSVTESLKKFSFTPDALVNCAGIVRFGSLLEQSTDDFKDVIDVNLLGCFIVSCATAKLMTRNGSGNIVNISSISGGKHPAVHSGAYAASKAGVVMLSEQMSLEWGKNGIRVNAISPGFIDSGMAASHYSNPVERKKREEMVPIQKIGTAEDIANVVMFLLSDKSSYVHGQNILVDGGVMNSVLANIARG